MNVATFGSQNVGNVIRMGNGIATISSVSSPTQVICDITQAITNTIPTIRLTGLFRLPAGNGRSASRLRRCPAFTI